MEAEVGGESSASPPKGTNRTDKQPIEEIRHPATKDVEKETEKQQQPDRTTSLDRPAEEEESNGQQNVTGPSQTKVTSATCIPKAAEPIKIELPSHHINGEIQFMQDYALIGKFLGFWPTEKALQGWIASKWKPKGQVTLQLGPKGFFTAIFNCLEDKTRIFEGGPYFFNSFGLYLTDWKPRFNPDKEDFSWAPVWIRMYSLPVEYWREETLADIGNKLGSFIKVATETKTRKYTSYARICVKMHLTKTLADMVSLFHDDYEWKQTLDYEHIPFRCRKCHEHGHLFRDCPLNVQPKFPSGEGNLDPEGFTKIPICRRHGKKTQANHAPAFKAPPQNRFSVLASQDIPVMPEADTPDPLQHSQTSPNRSEPTSSTSALPIHAEIPSSASEPGALVSSKGKTMLNEPTQESDMDLDVALALSLHDQTMENALIAANDMEEDREDVDLEEFDISKLDISKLEAACKQKEYNSIPPWQLDKIEGVLTRVQHHKSLGIQGGSHWDGRKIIKEPKKRGRKTDLQRTIAVGEILMDSGQFPKLTKFFKPKSPST